MKVVFKYVLVTFFMYYPLINAQNSLVDSFIKPLQEQGLYREKVFIHLNKTTYFVDEIIWFTAYVTKDKNNTPSEYTTNFAFT